MPRVPPSLRRSSISSATSVRLPTVNSSSPSETVIRMSSTETLGAVGGGGSGGSSGTGSGENEDSAWRNFCYEHPLHAATSAMLNLGGASALNEDAAVNSVGLVPYEHYYSNKSQQHQHHSQHHHLANQLPSLATAQANHKEDKPMNEVWS